MRYVTFWPSSSGAFRTKAGRGLLSLIVCPRIFPAVLPEQLVSSQTGRDATNEARPADAGDSFSAPRSYQPGDPLKRIHWKLSVKTRELYTRQYEIAVERHVLLILDNQDYGLIRKKAWLTGKRHAVGMFYRFLFGRVRPGP